MRKRNFINSNSFFNSCKKHLISFVIVIEEISGWSSYLNEFLGFNIVNNVEGGFVLLTETFEIGIYMIEFLVILCRILMGGSDGKQLA